MASFVTDFADQAVLLPVVAAVAIVLLASGWRRGAVAWTLVTVAVLVIMLVLKVASMACGRLVLGRELYSPSGHTAAAAAVYGGLIAVMVRRVSERAAWLWLSGAGVALTIGATRLILGEHTVIEVALGGFIGTGAAVAIAKFAGRPPARLRLTRVTAVVVMIALVFHGLRLPAEAAIRHSPLLHIWPLSSCTGHQR